MENEVLENVEVTENTEVVAEVPVDESFFEKVQNPLIMAVNGEHIVYIEVSEC